jgi:hypothetical protein
VLPLFILILTVEKRAVPKLPFCDPCNTIWMSKTLKKGTFVVPVVVVAIVVLALITDGAWIVTAVFLVVASAVLAFLHHALKRAVRVRVLRITASGGVRLGGVHQDAALAIEESLASHGPV